MKDTPLGKLPIVGPNGKTAWQTYARPFTPTEDGPRLGIVMEDLGLNRDRTQDAIDKLPPEVTLAFSPYSQGLQDWVDKARAAGHEVILAIPMEPINYPERRSRPRRPADLALGRSRISNGSTRCSAASPAMSA